MSDFAPHLSFLSVIPSCIIAPLYPPFFSEIDVVVREFRTSILGRLPRTHTPGRRFPSSKTVVRCISPGEMDHVMLRNCLHFILFLICISSLITITYSAVGTYVLRDVIWKH
jgi:hypothetical protein